MLTILKSRLHSDILGLRTRVKYEDNLGTKLISKLGRYGKLFVYKIFIYIINPQLYRSDFGCSLYCKLNELVCIES